MKYRREFEIAYVGLKNGTHTYTFDIGKPFFDLVEADSSEFEKVDVQVNVLFDKHPNFFELKFDINGTIDLPCDRCGDTFSLPIWDEFKLVIKLKEPTGEEELDDAEDDGDIVFLPKNETIIDLSEWIYEFLMLSIPMQKVHPLDENGESTCNKENLAVLKKLTQQAEEVEQKAKTEEIKNIWKGLDAFRDKNNN